MNSLLLFLIKSTLILSLLYLVFSVLMRKETFFQLNRMVLLVLVLSSLIIPIIYIPQPIHARIPVKLEPIFQASPMVEEPFTATKTPAILQSAVPAPETKQPVSIPIRTIVIVVYLSGVLASFLMFVYSIGSVLLLFSKARKTERNGIRIRIVDHDIPAFSFGRNILVSQHDFDTSYEAIITHEQSHIRLGHFYDLMLMELVKIVFWFNPLVYRMVSDLKEIHEFQADDHTLHSGIDAKQYQFLIIQKCVGHQKFALANSFNHCQIKNRITMMNKQKSSKAGLWKVATFLPLLALLLMSFGKTGESVYLEKKMSPQIVSTGAQDSVKKLIKTDTAPPPPTNQNKIIAPPPPPPNKDKHIIWMHNDGKVSYNLVETQIDELAEKVKSELQKNPKLQLSIFIEEGQIDKNVDKIEDILKANGNPNVQFFSFHEEKGTDSKGLLWSKVYSKSMNIK